MFSSRISDKILGTGTTYELTQIDVDSSITVSANYTDKLGNTESVISAATKSIINVNDLPTGSVVIFGITAKNNILTVSNTLADKDGLGVITYQWKTGKTVLGTGEIYILKQSDIGKTISVTATYTDGYNKVESVSSKSTSQVIDVTNTSNNTDSLNVTTKTKPYNEVSNDFAFAVIKRDGSVVTWGDTSSGGDSGVYHYDDATNKHIKDYSRHSAPLSLRI